MVRSAFLGLAAAAMIADPAAARAVELPLLAFARDGQCELEVTGNGKIFLVAVTGLGASGRGRYLVRNGDMKPIDWRITATPQGRWARYYMPFRWHRQGGEVQVSVETAECRLSAAFPWQRGIRVIS